MSALLDWGRRGFERPAGADEEYFRFCTRLMRLYTACRSAGIAATVKQLDTLLWQVPI